jgi:DNA-binding transcriptional ArsR family regulator
MEKQINLSGLDLACKKVCINLAKNYGLEAAENYRRVILGLNCAKPLSQKQKKSLERIKSISKDKGEKAFNMWKSKILAALGDDELNTKDIITKTKESQSNVKSWILRLEKAGIITGRAEGKGSTARRFYRRSTLESKKLDKAD